MATAFRRMNLAELVEQANRFTGLRNSDTALAQGVLAHAAVQGRFNRDDLRRLIEHCPLLIHSVAEHRKMTVGEMMNRCSNCEYGFAFRWFRDDIFECLPYALHKAEYHFNRSHYGAHVILREAFMDLMRAIKFTFTRRKS